MSEAYQTLMKFGQKAESEGDRFSAKKFYERAAKFGTALAQTNLANVIWADDPDRAIATLEGTKPENPVEAISVIRALVVFKEWRLRQKAGLRAFHAEGPQAMGFNFAVEEWIKYKKLTKTSEDHLIDQACVYFHDGGRDKSRFNFPGHVMGTVDFDLAPEECGNGGDKSNPAFWLGCDEKFLVFANPLIKSIKNHGLADDQLFLFKFDEHPKGAHYYHAARFIRLWEWMEKNDRPVWLLDVDAVANRSPLALHTDASQWDVALRGRPGRLEPWNQYNASVVGFNNTPKGRSYLKTISAFIQRAVDSDGLAWGIDQVAMLCCLEAVKPRIKWLGPKEVDYDYQDDGIIWCNSGRNKWRHLQPGCFDPDRQKYVEAFRKLVA